MKTVQVNFQQQEKASRVELLVRLVYWIPLVIVLSIITGISWIINLFSILILGKRFLSLTKFNALYVKYQVNMMAYYLFVTDERPPIIPSESD